MSLSSRGLLSKIYESNVNPSNRTKKKKSTLNFNSLGNKKNKKPKLIISSAIKEIEYKSEEKDDIKSNSKINKKIIINKRKLKNILEEKNINKFPVISDKNITSIKLINESKIKKTEEKNEEILEKNTILNYKIIESSSEDNSHPLRELKKGLLGQGWLSSRFSQYPQYIYVQFEQPVLIKRIDLVLHETSIPSMIKFYSYMPKNKDEYINNFKQVNYDYIGFIKTDTNERTNFESRESRKIHINSKSLFFKLELDKNHLNNLNLFNQIGLVKLEFVGDYLPYLGGNRNSNRFVLKHAVKRNFQNDMDLDDICGKKLTELKKQMNYNIEIENYLECKIIKKKIEKLRLYGKKIFDLESEKKIAINNEDFSKAIEIKNMIDKMKNNIQNIDNISISPRINDSNLFLNDIDNQNIKAKKYSNIPIDLINIPSVSKSHEFSAINESIYSAINNDNNMNNYNISIKNNNNFISLNNTASPFDKPVISEDIFGSYDETILPTVLKRLNHEETKIENENGEAEKGELEQISPKILQDFILITNVLGEENMRKIFSKQILWKEEGLKIFLERISEIIQKNNNTNEIISSILKISMILLEEKHPSVVIKTLEILKNLFEYIKKNNFPLNIDYKITDGLLVKIKEKLGDVNPKVRAKCVSLYCYMLSLNFCDYNNLISELVEEEIKKNDKYVPKSSSLILGKLDIFIKILNDFSDAIRNKRTSEKEFPSSLVIEYLIYNMSHSKLDVRKKARCAINLFLRNFEEQKFIKKLERVSERELSELISEFPDLQKHFPDITPIQKNESINLSKLFFKTNKKQKKIFLKSKFGNLGVNNSITNEEREKKENINNINIEKKQVENNDKMNDNDINENKEKKSKNPKNHFCKYCKTNLKENEVLANHWIINCPMFTICEKCSMNLEIKKLNQHRGNECKFKNEYNLCNNCNEYFLINEYDLHKKNQCFLKKGFINCPLCHQNLKDSDEDFYHHLMIQGCPYQKRKL